MSRNHPPVIYGRVRLVKRDTRKSWLRMTKRFHVAVVIHFQGYQPESAAAHAPVIERVIP